MSPSLQTMGFFMSDINFCNTKEQLNHLGEVVTGKVDGSPTGADIDTSTLPYTGQVRKTLPALEGEYLTAIRNAGGEPLNGGVWASGQTFTAYNQFMVYNGVPYKPLTTTTLPYGPTGATPDTNFVGPYESFSKADALNSFVNPNLFPNEAFEIPSSIANPPDATPRTYAIGSEIFDGVFAQTELTNTTYIGGTLDGLGSGYIDVFKTTKELLSSEPVTPSIAGSDGAPSQSGVVVVDNGDSWRVSFPISGVFSVKLERGNDSTLHKGTSSIEPVNRTELELEMSNGYKSIDIRVTGEKRPLAYFGKLTTSNHADVLKTAIEAAADESFKLYVPNKDILNLAGWTTPLLAKRLLIEFEDYTQINSDTAVDFIQLANTLQHDGIVTLDGFLAGMSFKNIVDDVELYSRGLRCKNGKHAINMRYSDNNGSGSLVRAIINDIQGHDMSSWGMDISPEVFGDMYINFPKFTNCKTRFIGIGNNATGENYSTNQRVEINGLTGIGLSEETGVGEVQGVYATGCQNVHLGGQTNIKDLVHTASSIDAEGIYIKAANTTIEDAVLENAGGNQGMIVVKGSASGAEVKSTCTVNAKITSTYGAGIPTCPAYVQADDVDLNLTLKGQFTRGVQTVEGAKVNNLTIKLGVDGVVCDNLVELTPNCETVEVSGLGFIKDVQSLTAGKRPNIVKMSGSASNPSGTVNLLKVRDINAREFTQNGGGTLSNMVEIDLGGDTGATIGKLSVVDNDLGDMHTCVRAVSGTIDQLAITGNDCMGGALPLNNSGATINNSYVKNNPGAADI